MERPIQSPSPAPSTRSVLTSQRFEEIAMTTPTTTTTPATTVRAMPSGLDRAPGPQAPGPVIANVSMSLDGFVADPKGGVAELFAWYTSGEEAVSMPGDQREFHVSRASAQLLRESVAQTGALVCGRRLFDLTHGWSGRHPTGAPVYVVTHQPPSDYPHDNATFVTDGVAAAIEQAHAAAQGRSVAIASADIARQCVDLGLLDAIKVDLVPVLLGTGIPFLAEVAHITRLADPVITPGRGVTHLYYAVGH
jgi:dihydrofolate reductase